MAEDAPLELRFGPRRVRIAVAHGRPTTFEIHPAGMLSRPYLDDLLAASGDQPRPWLFFYERASQEVRKEMRRRGLSYVGADGRCFVVAEGLLIDRERPAGRSERTQAPVGWHGLRTTRVPRFLLLHHEESFAVSEIAAATGLSVPTASRAVQALEDDGHVQADDRISDARRKVVRLRAPRPLLGDLLAVWQHRRLVRQAWDVGTSGVHETLRLLASVDARPLAVGGLAGAAMFERAVEPANVLIWVTRESLAALQEELMPMRTSPTRAQLRVAIAPDPHVLELSSQRGPGLHAVDPVQLWLDCSSEGERAIEASGAIERVMGW